jgi:hypothetical protein
MENSQHETSGSGASACSTYPISCVGHYTASLRRLRAQIRELERENASLRKRQLDRIKEIREITGNESSDLLRPAQITVF